MDAALYTEFHPAMLPVGESVPHVVLLHGWGLHAGVWATLVPLLQERCHVTTLDLPGFGRSPAPEGEYTLAALREQVLQAVPEPALWLGWSLGGLLALDIAAHHPEHVQGLVLVAANPRFLQDDDWPTAMPLADFAGFCGLVREDAERGLARFLALQCRGAPAMKEELRLLQALLATQALPVQETLLGGLALLQNSDLREAFAGLHMPVQIMLGEHDALVPATLREVIPALNPRADIVLLPGSGHLPFLSQTGLFAEAFFDFLRAHEVLM